MSALEIGQVGVGKERIRPASVPGELTITEETLRRLELPNTIKPEQIDNFLKQQSAKLNAIEFPEPLKAGTGDLPPPPDMAAQGATDEVVISDAEFEALQMFSQSVNQRYAEGGMGIQSPDGEGDITETMGSVIEYLRNKYGEIDAGSDAESGDIIDWFLMAEIGEEAGEIDEKWEEIFTQLTKGGRASPEAIIMAMTEYFGEKYGTVLRRAIRTFSDRVETHEKFVADLGLSEGSTLSATELQQASAEQQANMMDSQMAMQTIQTLKQQIDKVQTQGKSELDAYHVGQKEIIRNVTT